MYKYRQNRIFYTQILPTDCKLRQKNLRLCGFDLFDSQQFSQFSRVFAFFQLNVTTLSFMFSHSFSLSHIDWVYTESKYKIMFAFWLCLSAIHNCVNAPLYSSKALRLCVLLKNQLYCSCCCFYVGAFCYFFFLLQIFCRLFAVSVFLNTHSNNRTAQMCSGSLYDDAYLYLYILYIVHSY